MVGHLEMVIPLIMVIQIMTLLEEIFVDPRTHRTLWTKRAPKASGVKIIPKQLDQNNLNGSVLDKSRKITTPK